MNSATDDIFAGFGTRIDAIESHLLSYCRSFLAAEAPATHGTVLTGVSA